MRISDWSSDVCSSDLGVEARQITLPGTREPPRREYFLRGTAQTELAAAPQTARRPRITSPVSGSVYALDPDIPIDRQRLAVTVSGDRTSVGWGKSVSVRVDIGGRRIVKKK